jgi:hypothetical protein
MRAELSAAGATRPPASRWPIRFNNARNRTVA